MGEKIMSDKKEEIQALITTLRTDLESNDTEKILVLITTLSLMAISNS